MHALPVPYLTSEKLPSVLSLVPLATAIVLYAYPLDVGYTDQYLSRDVTTRIGSSTLTLSSVP